MKKMLQSLGQLVYPNMCVCCDSYLSHQEGKVCDLCHYTLPKFEAYQQKDNTLAKRFWGRVKLENATGYLRHQKSTEVTKILHDFKYRGNSALAIEMGEALGRSLSKTQFIGSVDCVIPVPLHPKRERIRGYNQSDLLVEGICNQAPCKGIYDALVRQKHNSTQTKKKRYERFINAKEIFRVAKPEKLQNSHVLLIDDVITTGATIEACAEALLDVKGVQVSVACLAVAS